MQPSDLDRAYLAGIVDGEGCITASVITRWRPDGTRQSWTEVQSALTIANTDRRLIDWIAGYWPGNIRPVTRRSSTFRQGWHFRVSGSDLPAMLTSVAPYLVVKREQAELVLELYRLKRRRGDWYYTPGQQARRLEIIRQIQELNRPVEAQRHGDRRTGARRA
jgi:hypothetical protein